jgi:tetratricopeptide (TPR) repeat protein
MSEKFSLKPVLSDAIPEAVEKAEHYRLLNDPEQAESICLDILEVDPKNQKALVVLILAITDQFASPTASPAANTAREYVRRLTDEYRRLYYNGLISERQGRAYLVRNMAGAFAYEDFREAMDWFEQAEKVRPKGNDDAVLRWNSCVRTIERENLEPRPHEGELPLE